MAGLLWYRSYMDSLANTNGYYPDIHAGHADRVSELTLDAPYLVRETPAGYNQLELMELVGGSVAWNQLCNSSSVTGTSGHKFYLKKSGVESITNTNTFTGLASGTDMVTDLTQMFGSTIADYVYSLEQSQAGSGIAWLKKYDLIDDNYHAYSTGSLESVNVSAHVMRDADNNIIETYPIDSSVTLRGILKTDANGNLYYEGDTYEWDGTVTRKYAEVDLGSLNWSKSTMGIGDVFLTPLIAAKAVSGNTKIFNGVSAVFRTVSRAMLNIALAEDVIALNTSKQLIIHPTASYADAAAFKTAMNGCKLCYELDESAYNTESADPYTAVQTVEDGGTVEFVTSNNIPVGNVSIYRRV